ncbi:MAG: hypothetical protein MZV65_13415 [Chromatiales bacterium]|nr:hypothetical protein [Chromatiales bacterium]
MHHLVVQGAAVQRVRVQDTALAATAVPGAGHSVTCLEHAGRPGERQRTGCRGKPATVARVKVNAARRL